MANSGKNVNRDYIEPEVAVELSRQTLAEFELNSEESLAAYLPSLEVADVEYEIDRAAQDNAIVAANWRSFGGATTSETWGQGERGRGRLLPLARNYVIDEYQRLKQRNDAVDAIGREAASLVERGTKAIAKQINYQRGNALANGQVEIQGSGGMREVVDFGRRAEFDTTAPQLFTDPDSDPIAYLDTLVEQYEDVNGFRPAEIMMSSKVKRALFVHPKVVLGATGNEFKQRATNSEVQNLLDEFDLPQIKLISPAKTRFDNFETGETIDKYNLPQDSILLTAGAGDPADPMSSLYGRTFWGQTVSAELPEFGLRGSNLDVPGIVAAVFEEGWPYNMEVIVDALAMPVVFSPDYTLKAKVV